MDAVPVGKKRESKRREKRKHASYLVRTKATQRTPLSPSEVKYFFEAIDTHSSSRFGILKLSVLDLDQIHNPTNLSGLVEWQPLISLLAYSTFRSEYTIVISLLKAGADPSVRMNILNQEKIFTEGAQEHFSQLPISYAVFILEALMEMRRIGCLLPQENRKSCHVCSLPLSQPLQSTCCQNVYCEDCLWEYNITQFEKASGILLESGAGIHNSVQAEIPQFCCPNCHKGIGEASACEESFQVALSATLKKESFEKWSALPDELPKVKPPKSKLKPLRYLEAQSLFLGKTKSARNEELWLAASSGFCARLKCLLAAGVDLEVKNEYGQTALFLAAMGGYEQAVKLLLSNGADPTVRDNAGVSPLLSAISLRRNSVINLLRDLGLNETIIPPLSDPLNIPEAQITTIVPISSPHPGAGTCYLDNIFSNEFLEYLDSIIKTLPISPPTKIACSDRAYFCDSIGWISEVITNAIRCIPEFKTNQIRIFPNMRILIYSKSGGSLPAHVDLTRVDPCTQITSSHSFLLYLTDCSVGGETLVLQRLKGAREVIGGAQPKRGRLLVMPHACPHEGNIVGTVPKILIRGEFY